MASNSRPISSICSEVRRVSGLSIRVAMVFLSCGSEFDLDRALGRVDAGADHLAVLAVDVARTQVADPAGAQTPDAGVTDAHSAPKGKRGSGVFSGHEYRLRAVGLGVHAARAEMDR